MTETGLIPAAAGSADGLARYQPADLKQLVWFAGEVAKSGMYLKTDANGNQVAMTQAETFMVMSEGIEMGVSPLTAMRNIYLMEDRHGRKTTIPRADLIAARIQADPRTEEWDVDDSVDGTVTVTGKRRGRDRVTLTLTLKDIPAQHRDRWAKGYLDTQDMLVNRTVRRIAKRYFKDMVLGLGVDDYEEPRRVIDVAAVEREVGRSEFGPHKDCGGTLWLEASRTGGAYLRCDRCGATSSPPDEVRDVIRGTPPALTIAATGETVEENEEQPPPEVPERAAANGGGLAPGEREMTTEEAASFALEPETPADGASPREGRISALQAFLEAQRASASLEQKQRTRDALLAAGWDGRMGVPAMLGAMSDSTLELLERELLKVPA